MMSIKELKDLLEKYNLFPKKSLGQSFLFHNYTLEKIVSAVDPNIETLVEIGPGIGSLTKKLLACTNIPLIVIEKDKRFLKPLEELRKRTRHFNIIFGDALKVAPPTCTAPLCVIGNLPYNISTLILLKYLRIYPSQIIFMFQKEVAKRILSHPNTKDYGRLSIMTQWSYAIKKIMEVPPQYFFPAPKIISTVLELRPKSSIPPLSWTILEKLVGSAFQQRRKMLKSSLISFAQNYHIPSLVEWLEAHHILPSSRAESLCVEQFCELANSLTTFVNK